VKELQTQRDGIT